VGSFTSSPVVVPLSVPVGKVAGDSFTVSVEASDAAHNTATAQRDVMVISDGVIVGQVLVDTTGLPLPGASVHMTSTSGVLAATTDERGRYSFPTGDAVAIVSVENAGMTSGRARAHDRVRHRHRARGCAAPRRSRTPRPSSPTAAP
jgi:hypothetical protein